MKGTIGYKFQIIFTSIKTFKYRIVVNPDENEENEEAEQPEDGQQNDHYHYMLMAMANQIMCMMLKIILLICFS